MIYKIYHGFCQRPWLCCAICTQFAVPVLNISALSVFVKDCKIRGTCQARQVLPNAKETKPKSVCLDFDMYAACLGSEFFKRTEDLSCTQTSWRVTCFILVWHTYKTAIWWTHRGTSLTNCGFSWQFLLTQMVLENHFATKEMEVALQSSSFTS